MSIKRIFHDPIHKEIVFDAGKPEELMIMELKMQLFRKKRHLLMGQW